LLPIKYNNLKKCSSKILGTFTQENPGKSKSDSSVQPHKFPLQLKKNVKLVESTKLNFLKNKEYNKTYFIKKKRRESGL